MPAPKKYRQTTPFFFNAEVDRFNDFKEISHKEKKSVQEKLNEVNVSSRIRSSASSMEYRIQWKHQLQRTQCFVYDVQLVLKFPVRT